MLSEELEDEPDEPGDVIATKGEVEAAVQDVQCNKSLRKRLDRAAYVLLQTTSVLKKMIEPEDLVGEAILAVLQGRRKWRKNKVDFPGLLVGAMKSLAWSRDKTMKTTMPQLVLENEFDPLDSGEQVLDTLAVDPMSPQRLFENAEQRAEEDAAMTIIRAQFGPAELAGQILDQMRLREGFSDAEIRKALEVSDREYWNARKVLARAVDKFIKNAKDSK